MAKQYHISADGELRECTAKIKCRLNSPHFDTLEEGQRYQDSLYNSTSTKVTLRRINTNKDIIKYKAVREHLNKLDRKIQHTIESKAKFEYKQLKAKMKKHNSECMPFEEFLENFKELDEEYNFVVKKKEHFKKEILEMIEERKQAEKFYFDTTKHIETKSFSGVSSSAYFVYKEKSLNKVLQKIKQSKMQYMIRPDIKENLEDNFLVRFSTHKPNLFIKSKDDIKNIWKYTDASILVFYDKVKVDESQDIEQAIQKFEKSNI